MLNDAALPEARPTSLRVVIADDAALLREGLCRLLRDAGFDVVGLAEDLEGLLDCVTALRPDVVVADIRMPPTHTTEGLEATRQIRASWPRTAVVLLSHHIETHHVLDLLETDPRGLGYVLKDRVADVGQLADVIRRVGRGESVIDPEVVSRLVRRSRRHDPLGRMTGRERDVLTLMAHGRSNHAIAQQLCTARRPSRPR